MRSAPETPVVLVETKADLVNEPARRDDGAVPPRVQVSAKTGEGLGELRSVLPRLVYAGLVEARGDVPVLTRRRHVRGVEEARRHLSNVDPQVQSAFGYFDEARQLLVATRR